MPRRRSIFFISALVFIVGFMAATVVFKTKGPHTWHRAHVELIQLNECVEFYQQEKGEYPSEATVQAWLEHIWSSKGEIDYTKNNDEFEELSVLYRSDSYHRLKRWGRPIYLVSKTIPSGRGFYSLGDDGVSSTQGKDPDDINSWDYSSISHYHRRLWRGRYIQYTIFALVPTIIVTSFLVWKRHQ